MRWIFVIIYKNNSFKLAKNNEKSALRSKTIANFEKIM